MLQKNRIQKQMTMKQKYQMKNIFVEKKDKKIIDELKLV